MTGALPYDWSDIRQRLQRDLAAVLMRLGLRDDGHGGPRLMLPLNPTRRDRRPGSFVIWLTGDAAGGWKDYASGEQGDVLDLVAYIKGFTGRIDAYWWALDHLRLDRQGHAVTPRRRADIDAERARREREAKAAEARQAGADKLRSAALFRRWLELPPIAGTPAETYLREARGLDMARLRQPPGALRWCGEVEWIDPETGEVTVWRNLMVAAMTRDKKVVGLHRTVLRPDGSGKADVERPKTMIGPVRGAAIRLSAGVSGLSPAKAAAAGRCDPLAIGEGIETSLSVACAKPDWRVWAAGSLSLMGLVDWPACASAVVLLRDNDWKPEAQSAFKRVEAHWLRQAQGRPLQVANSAVGSDFNDMVRAG